MILNYTGYSNNDSQITLSNYFINSHGVVHYLFPDTRRIWRPYTWYILQTSSEFCGTSLNHLSGKLLDYFFRSHCAWETLCLCVQGGEWGAKGTVLGRGERGISGEREGYQGRGRDTTGWYWTADLEPTPMIEVYSLLLFHWQALFVLRHLCNE